MAGLRLQLNAIEWWLEIAEDDHLQASRSQLQKSCISSTLSLGFPPSLHMERKFIVHYIKENDSRLEHLIASIQPKKYSKHYSKHLMDFKNIRWIPEALEDAFRSTRRLQDSTTKSSGACQTWGTLLQNSILRGTWKSARRRAQFLTASVNAQLTKTVILY